jgi:hypothetical protein
VGTARSSSHRWSRIDPSGASTVMPWDPQVAMNRRPSAATPSRRAHARRAADTPPPGHRRRSVGTRAGRTTPPRRARGIKGQTVAVDRADIEHRLAPAGEQPCQPARRPAGDGSKGCAGSVNQSALSGPKTRSFGAASRVPPTSEPPAQTSRRFDAPDAGRARVGGPPGTYGPAVLCDIEAAVATGDVGVRSAPSDRENIPGAVVPQGDAPAGLLGEADPAVAVHERDLRASPVRPRPPLRRRSSRRLSRS